MKHDDSLNSALFCIYINCLLFVDGVILITKSNSELQFLLNKENLIKYKLGHLILRNLVNDIHVSETLII